MLGGQGIDEGREFAVVVGHRIPSRGKYEFWQDFADNGDLFRMTCNLNAKRDVCSGIWYDHVLNTSGPWEMSKSEYPSEDHDEEYPQEYPSEDHDEEYPQEFHSK